MDQKQPKSGKVKFYSRSKGFGFIAVAGERDVFVHATDLPDGVDELRQDQKVQFTEVDHMKDGVVKGPRAKEIILV